MSLKLRNHTPRISRECRHRIESTYYLNEPRRSSRTAKPSQRDSLSLNYIFLTEKGELKSYEKVVQVDESIKYKLAMRDEMDSLMSNQTWSLANLLKGKKDLQNK